ncbi:hypothetical protein CKO32_17245 [Afifella marina DSM 2698]|nr:hypothetical protein [Afifella marina DSM 2698]MBK1628847.1 hypothetical protein [Afifella marina]MBK5916849.1 hypothetical protein [Afifella marina]RAI17933.1 hypothetical protein CH311_16990 [Afifella marina DSM 2698]
MRAVAASGRPYLVGPIRDGYVSFPATATCTLMCFGALRRREAAPKIVALGLAVAGLGSACSGTMFLSFLVAART